MSNVLEIDSRETLEVRKWKTKSIDRQLWTYQLKEVMARLRAVSQQKTKKNKKKYSITNRKDTYIHETQDKKDRGIQLSETRPEGLIIEAEMDNVLCYHKG
jgi:hypothetical protein